MVKSYKNEETPYDEPYNPFLAASISGISIFLYLLLLSTLVLWTIIAESKWP